MRCGAVPVEPTCALPTRADTADNVAVTVEVPPASASDAGATLNVTLGGGSSSVIVAVICCVPDSVPLVTSVMSTTIVSVSEERRGGKEGRVAVAVGGVGE